MMRAAMETNAPATAHAPTPTPEQRRKGDRMAMGSILFAAVRCTIQYILLPFALPFVGVGGVVSAAISAVLSLVALGFIAFNIRDLWHTSWRYRYLGLGIGMTVVIAIFLYQDARVLFGWP
jgi:FtsH-binding integral membrane protein